MNCIHHPYPATGTGKDNGIWGCPPSAASNSAGPAPQPSSYALRGLPKRKHQRLRPKRDATNLDQTPGTLWLIQYITAGVASEVRRSNCQLPPNHRATGPTCSDSGPSETNTRHWRRCGASVWRTRTPASVRGSPALRPWLRRCERNSAVLRTTVNSERLSVNSLADRDA
jgi:hypothetical protein